VAGPVDDAAILGVGGKKSLKCNGRKAEENMNSAFLLENSGLKSV
jgi:hypothetical protein